MPFIIVIKRFPNAREEQTQTKEIATTILRIGRGTDNDLHLEDHSVQLHHAVIQEISGAYVLRDLNPVSLTSVNGNPTKEALLATKGTIAIGPYALRFTRSTDKSSLRIEYEEISDSVSTSKAIAEATLVMKTVVLPPRPSAAPSPPVPSPPGAAPPSPSGAPGTPAVGPSAVPEDLFAPMSRRKEGLKVPFVAAYCLHGRIINKTTIALASVLLVVGSAILSTAMGKRTVLMPGPVSAKHASFAHECVRCHTQISAMKTAVPDSTCTACHKSPMHFGTHSLAAPLNCTSCHVVHKGSMILASATGKDCLRCHADLKVKDPSFDIHRTIRDFATTHPEFAVMVYDSKTDKTERVRLDDTDRLKDGTMIKLNHKLHLDPDLPGLESGPLQCTSCHKTAERKGYFMQPIKFEAACVQCHALDFDSKFPDKTVPHGKPPRELDLFLRILYPSLWPLSEEAQAGGKAAAKRQKAWIEEQVEKAEEKLLGKMGTRKRGKCQLCHINDTSPHRDLGTDGRFPVLAKSSIPERWFLNSNFNHAAHTMTKCVTCHEAAPQSEATTDVLLPKVATCRKCHDARGTARSSCLECHLFHEIPRPKQAQDPPARNHPPKS